MSVIRAFIAVSLSLDITRSLDQVMTQLKEHLPDGLVRWTPAKNIHLTVKFLGDVSLSNLEILKKIILSEASRCPSFEISIGGLGAFPSIHRPRVVWVGVAAPPELNLLQHGIEAETTRLGYPLEDRPFSPHLTLGRVGRNATPNDIRRAGEEINRHKVGFLGAVRVAELHLYKSDLLPGGSVYTRLFSAPLGLANHHLS